MATRITKEVLYVRCDFTQEERLKMGDDLAGAYNRKQQIDEEEKVMKAQIKDRQAAVDATIGTLSRNLGNGWEMRNVDCSLRYDSPNVGEVTYVDANGKEIKTRAMSETERQMDLPLEEKTDTEAEASAEKSAENIVGFFGSGDGEGEPPEEDEDEQEPRELDPDNEPVLVQSGAKAGNGKSGPVELKAYHEDQVKKEGSKKRKTNAADAF